jgi:hypothetical protein
MKIEIEYASGMKFEPTGNFQTYSSATSQSGEESKMKPDSYEIIPVCLQDEGNTREHRRIAREAIAELFSIPIELIGADAPSST